MPTKRTQNTTLLPTVSLPPRWMRIPPRLPELVEIPAGAFVMGDDFGPREARPAHDLILDTFFCARYPVTMLEFAAYILDTRRPMPGWWPHPLRWIEEANLPVARVSWRESILYCEWLTRKTGYRAALPTEPQWEKAALWDDEQAIKRIYPWGDEFDPACCNVVESLVESIAPVDAYRTIGDSAYGVSDMFGNAAEWTLSRFTPYPYEDKRHDTNVMGYRVARGGSYQSEGRWTTALHRGYFSPDENRYPVGFRIIVIP
jgi:formylglycine-generating enzyme required for sulfatase activity